MSNEELRKLADTPLVRSYLGVRGTAVYIVDADGGIVWASESMKDVTGHTVDQLVGHNAWKVLVPPADLPVIVDFRAALSASDGTIWAQVFDPKRERVWIRADAIMRSGGIIIAIRRETDPAEQYPHVFLRPPRRHD